MKLFGQFGLLFCFIVIGAAKPILLPIAALSQVPNFGIPADVTIEDRIAFLKELQISDLMPKNLSEFMNAQIDAGYGRRVYQTLNSVLEGRRELKKTDLMRCCGRDFEEFLQKHEKLSLKTKAFLKMVIEMNANLDDKNVSNLVAVLEQFKNAALKLANDEETINELLKAFSKDEFND